MKIRTQITLLFTVVTASILLLFSSIIYYSAQENREKEFFSRLRKEALTKANVFFEAHIEARILQDIYKNNQKTINEVEVAIYDTSFALLYHDAMDIDYVKETQAMTDEVIRKGEISFYQENWQVVGIRYLFQHKNYIVFATAYDKYGYNKLNHLLATLVAVFVVSMLFIYVAGHFFSQKVLSPMKEMIEKAKQISVSHLDLRLNTNGSKDELSELAHTFNEMLDRLEYSFDSQKQFVSNISHELRTPLAAIIAELELSITKDRNKEEYITAIQQALKDTQKLVRLSNSLLDLAKASYDPSEIAFKNVRIDEILLDATMQIQRNNPNYHIDIYFECDFEDDRFISVYGNEYLLKVAFINLFENGCKFSTNHTSKVSIQFTEKKLILRFIDEGVGIQESDLKYIFTPFYRGENKIFAEGNGIGLPLTQKIIDLHSGSIAVISKPKQGTTFIVTLTHTSCGQD